MADTFPSSLLVLGYFKKFRDMGVESIRNLSVGYFSWFSVKNNNKFHK